MDAKTPPNIEMFNRAVLYTLTTLYEHFPRTLHLSEFGTSEISNVIAPDNDGRSATEDDMRDVAPVLIATIQWLEDEGFIRVSNRDEAPIAFYHARLTAKGLSLMGMPTSLEGPQETVYQQSKNVLGAGIKKGATDLVGMIIRESVRGMIGGGPIGPA